MPALRLKVIEGAAKGSAIPLGDQPLLIGRAAGGAGRLGDDPELSRRHARVYEDDGRIRVEDLGSTHGTFVNGRRIEGAVELRAGDSLAVGATTLKLEAPPGPDVTVKRPVRGEGSKAILRVVAGPEVGRGIQVTGEPLVIGRAAEADEKLEDPQLSRRHARLSEVGGRLVVQDLGSTNGTFVNGRQIRGPTPVQPGDAIWAGNTTLTLTSPTRPVPEVAPIEPPTPSGEAGMLSRFAELSDTHARVILAAIAVFFVTAAVIGSPVVKALENNPGGFEDPGGQAAKTEERIAAATGEIPGAQLVVLVSGQRPVTSQRTRREVARIERAVRRDPMVSRTQTFYKTGDRELVSRNRKSTLIAAYFKNVKETEREHAAERIAKRVDRPPAVLVGGGALAKAQLNERVSEDLAKAETVAFPILFLLSLYVFRGFVAALLPIFVGSLTIVATLLALRAVNGFVELSPFALNVVVGLGLGLAIDYSLFIVSRYREELARVGMDGAFAGSESEALRRAIYTAGRTVLYSGATVAIALATLCVIPLPVLYSMGLGGALTALIAVTVSLVALPSLLAVLGPRVNALAPQRWQRAALRTASHEREGPWYRLAQAVMRRPALVAATSATFLILLGLPALGMKFTDIDISSVPPDLTTRQVNDAVKRDFAADSSNQITALVEARRDQRKAVEAFAAKLRGLPGANSEAVQPAVPLKGGLWEVSVIPTRRPLDERTIDLVNEIRAGPHPFPVAVTGDTAKFLDQRSAISSHLPVAILLLVCATLIVLFLMTGSVVLPIKSLLMNALSLSAALGLVVLIFQHGNLEGLLGFQSLGAIDQAQPVLLFAIAFGLATDYGVFLITRIKEAYTRGESNTESVAFGLERTGRIITQAAILFCVAIGAFATSSVLFVKEIGLGTALAIIIDASVIRAFLVPSLMALLGRRNWWAPGPLRRLHSRIGLSEA